MTRLSIPRRVALAGLAVMLLALPAVSLWVRDIVHFYSGFEQQVPQGPGGSGGGILALGGGLEFSGSPNVFELDLSGPEGVLLVHENGQSPSAQMLAELDDATYQSQVEVSFDLDMLDGPSDLVLWVADDDGGGMIDLIFDDEGTLTIDGQAVLLHGAAASSEYALKGQLILREGMLGVNTWALSLTTPSGVLNRTGVLSATGPMRVGGVGVVRPGLATGGTWAMDNLFVTSPKPGGAASQQ